METLVMMSAVNTLIMIFVGMLLDDDSNELLLRVIFGQAINAIIWYIFFR